MKKTFIEIIILMLLTVIILGVLEYRSIFFQETLLDEPSTVIIEKGASLTEIGQVLFDEDVIRNKDRFISIVKLQNASHQLKAGRYMFFPDDCLNDVIKKLKKGETYEEFVTFPEGKTIKQIGQILNTDTHMDSSQFVAYGYSEQLTNNYDIPNTSLEGYLYPETYKIYWGMEEKKLIDLMVSNTKNVFTDSLTKRCNTLDLSVHDVLTLASIIEKEAMVDSERKLISAVFHNRLDIGRRLESCATVLYALGKHKNRLLKKDLKVKSDYNTYIHNGLPPGPICNPGKKSIYAALYPADVDYLYFVSKGDGTHIFSETNREHINAKHSRN